MSDMQLPAEVSARFPDLDGKVAIVTGASQGIGCGIAEFLGRQGMKLMLASLPGEDGEAFADQLRRAGMDVHFAAADLATPEGARTVFDAAVERFARIDLLVNNAADRHSTSFLKLDEEVFHSSCERNIRIVYGLSFLVARHMAAADAGGGIVHISSVGGLQAHYDNSGYDAAKGAVDALTRAMALDLSPHRIRVNAVAPGAINNRVDARRAEEYKKRAAAGGTSIPLARLGSVEDIAAAVAFLASNAADYITGQVLYVDGGLTAQLVPRTGPH